jgi:hypothetical protein
LHDGVCRNSRIIDHYIIDIAVEFAFSHHRIPAVIPDFDWTSNWRDRGDDGAGG